MASPFPSTPPFSASTHLQPSSTMSAKLYSPSLASSFKGCSSCKKMQKSMLSLKPYGVRRREGSGISCAMNMSAGQSDEAGRRLSVEDVMEKARNLWDSCPESVKRFPWDRTLENFIQLVLDLVVEVIKYLYIPVVAFLSRSEMHYCRLEKKISFIPIPLLVGVATAWYLGNKALELSPGLKEKADVPWHLIAMGILFTLIKLPGPYYRYWGRIMIPQFANGGILRTLWLTYLWYKPPQMSSYSSFPE